MAYVKKCKEVNDLSEEDFDDLMNDTEESCAECQPERTYTTLHTDSDAVKTYAPVQEETEENETSENDSETDTASEETSEDVTETEM